MDQRLPARMAQMMRCGAWRTSALTAEVPWSRAGTLQRARKTPHTITSETVTGLRPMDTSLAGASAAPSQAPAAMPLRRPAVRSARRRQARSAGQVLIG